MKSFQQTVTKTAAFILAVSLVISSLPPDIAFAANTKLRQEINITDGYLGSPSGSYATSSAIIRIDTTKYNGATYYFEVVASTTSAVSSNIYLKNATTYATISTINFSNSNTYTRYRSSSFTPTSGANDYVVVVGNEAVQKGAIATRVVILQDASTITSTETQIEIGNQETYTSSATSTLASPKYWYYDSSKWDGSTTFAAEVVYKRVTDATVASSTTYSAAGTYTVAIPSNTASTSIQLWGGGGGGGAGSVNSNGSGSGGAGGTYAKKTIQNLAGLSKTLVVGAAGTGGVSTAAGSQGATSTWDTSVVVAGGGMGGQPDSGAAGTGLTTGSTGDIVNKGGDGAVGTSGGTSGGGGEGGCTSGNGNNASSGTGGNGCDGGDGANGQSTNGTPAAGTAPGGGGAGGRSTGTPNADGGAGAIGRAIITDGINQTATTTIALQADDGSFGNWGTPGGNQQITLVASGTASTATRVRVSFTPVSGRNYRIVMKNGFNGATWAIYTAKIIVGQTASSGGSGDITSNLKAFYRFEEGSGSAPLDSSGNNYTANTTNGPSYVTGKIESYAMSFTAASTQYATLPSGTSIVADGGDFSVAFWIKFTTTSRGIIWGEGNTTNTTPFVLADINPAGQSTGTVGFRTRDDSGNLSNYAVTTNALNDGQWHHVVFTGSGTHPNRVRKIYVDGSSGGTTLNNEAYSVGGTQDSFEIGALQNGSTAQILPLDGSVDDLRLYNRELSATDVSDLYTYTGASASPITKLEPQYLLANTLLASGTSLQKFLTSWASTEWTSTNTYFHEIDSGADTSVVELDTESGVPLTNSSLTANAVRKRSTVGITMPSDGNLDMKATANNGSVYASRIIVQADFSAAAAAAATAKKGLVHVAGKIFRVMGKTLHIK